MGTNCRWNHLLRLEDFLFHWFIDWNTYYCEFKDDVWRRMPSCYLVIYMHQSISDKETDVGSRSKPGQLGFRKSRSDGRENNDISYATEVIIYHLFLLCSKNLRIKTEQDKWSQLIDFCCSWKNFLLASQVTLQIIIETAQSINILGVEKGNVSLVCGNFIRCKNIQ